MKSCVLKHAIRMPLKKIYLNSKAEKDTNLFFNPFLRIDEMIVFQPTSTEKKPSLSKPLLFVVFDPYQRLVVCTFSQVILISIFQISILT